MPTKKRIPTKKVAKPNRKRNNHRPSVRSVSDKVSLKLARLVTDAWKKINKDEDVRFLGLEVTKQALYSKLEPFVPVVVEDLLRVARMRKNQEIAEAREVKHEEIRDAVEDRWREEIRNGERA